MLHRALSARRPRRRTAAWRRPVGTRTAKRGEIVFGGGSKSSIQTQLAPPCTVHRSPPPPLDSCRVTRRMSWPALRACTATRHCQSHHRGRGLMDQVTVSVVVADRPREAEANLYSTTQGMGGGTCTKARAFVSNGGVVVLGGRTDPHRRGTGHAEPRSQLATCTAFDVYSLVCRLPHLASPLFFSGT